MSTVALFQYLTIFCVNDSGHQFSFMVGTVCLNKAFFKHSSFNHRSVMEEAW